MSLYEICERCQSREAHWLIREWNITVGELARKPHLCEGCTKIVQDAVIAALRPKPASLPEGR